ncbi:RNA cytidine acetyltransferase [Nymphon striatum]|nr:RNA cytidine acetyltransferase [Nymphon striatum]
MDWKKIDNRIRVMIENGVALNHRSFFVVVGDRGRDQIVILHHLLSKAVVKARPSVLWCYKKELGFSSHRKKRMKKLQKTITKGQLDSQDDDKFQLFVVATNIRYSYYKETHKILGQTFGMCVLQDFEALTPNLLARTVETVEGGGIIVLLLQSVTSLRQLYTMSMEVHSRYRTEAHKDVVGRFNERFILSLASCKQCIVVDDQLNILPISSHCSGIVPIPTKTQNSLSKSQQELKDLKESLQDTQPVGTIVNCAKTLDQAKVVMKFIDAISEKTLRSTVTLTAARGRGKSAALGLAISSAVAFNYSNIFVTAPSPENLKTVFEFIVKGFDALGYEEHMDYDLIQSTNADFLKAVIRVDIYKEHRQTIQYIHPTDAHKLGLAELVVIDEAAAIPLPLVKKLFGPYLVFMSSTINGYEGTGRSLSLKLISSLREQAHKQNNVTSKHSANNVPNSAAGRALYETELNESIRYNNGDSVEAWLNNMLCLDASVVPRMCDGCPPPDDYTLFCYHKYSEAFLQRLMSLYVASHYKNSPNDLQMLSDAPAHHLFCLLGPINSKKGAIPEILTVIQVCLEGEISKTSVEHGLSRGKGAAGDLIPWTIAQQFQDSNFPKLSGGRIVRIATHPDYQKMGYGLRALQLLEKYYDGQIPCLNEASSENDDSKEIHNNYENKELLTEEIKPRNSLPALLLKLSERPPERLDYLGVSYGVTSDLFRFWKKSRFVPVYVRQTANNLTGEHSCIMLKTLSVSFTESKWLPAFWHDFQRRFVSLLSYQFRDFRPSLCLNILINKEKSDNKMMTKRELEIYLSSYDVKRLSLYSQNLVDYHLIMDLLPTLAKLYFLSAFHPVSLPMTNSAILLGIGLQHKTDIDKFAVELDLQVPQLLGIFNKTIRRINQHLNEIMENTLSEETFPSNQTPVTMEPLSKSLNEDLTEAANEFEKNEEKKRKTEISVGELSQYQIQGTERDWENVLNTSKSQSLVSVKRYLEHAELRFYGIFVGVAIQIINLALLGVATKVMKILKNTTNNQDHIQVNGEKIDNVDNFVYMLYVIEQLR